MWILLNLFSVYKVAVRWGVETRAGVTVTSALQLCMEVEVEVEVEVVVEEQRQQYGCN